MTGPVKYTSVQFTHQFSFLWVLFVLPSDTKKHTYEGWASESSCQSEWPPTENLLDMRVKIVIKNTGRANKSNSKPSF